MNKNNQSAINQQVNPQNQTVSYSVPKKPVIFNDQNTTQIQQNQHQHHHHSDKRKPLVQQQQIQHQIQYQIPISKQIILKNESLEQINPQQQHQHTYQSKPVDVSTKNAANIKNSNAMRQQQQHQLHQNFKTQPQQVPQNSNYGIPQHLKQQYPLKQNVQYQFHTPTQQEQPVIVFKNKKSPHKVKKRNRREFNLTCRILEAKLLVDLAKMFQMSVHCQITYKDDVKKTKSQSGKFPKWNESFSFIIKDENAKTQHLEFEVFHKPLIYGEEKIGKTIFNIQLSPYNLTDWFILQNDKNETVGSILICITIDQMNKNESDVVGKQALNGSDENVDEGVEPDDSHQSIDLRDQEISRSVAGNSKKKKYLGGGVDKKVSQNQLLAGGAYIGIQTQQNANQNGNSYLNTQMNQPRQSLTEHSMIQHSNSHSSNDSMQEGGGEGMIQGNQIIKVDSTLMNLIRNGQKGNNINLVSAMDEEGMGQLIPQQLFYGSGGSGQEKNLYLKQQQQLQQMQYQQNKIQQSHFLAVEDLQTNFGQGGVGAIQANPQVKLHNHGDKHTHKKCNRRKRKLAEAQLQQQQQQQLLTSFHQIQNQQNEYGLGNKGHKKHRHQEEDNNEEYLVEGIPEEYGIEVLVNQQEMMEDFEEQEINQNDVDEEVNYGQYLNQRSHQQLYGTGQTHQAISSSQSQQMLKAINKVNIGFESGGGNSSGSGGVAQQFFNNNMNVGLNMGGGSNGSYVPGSSYFEEQHSVESLNNEPQLQANIYSQDVMRGFLEENERIKGEEERLKRLYEMVKIESQKLSFEKQEFRKTKSQFKQSQKKFEAQKEDFEYQRQQMERQYLNLKKEKIKRSQQAQVMEEMLKTFTSLLNKSKILQNPNSAGYNSQKIDEFVQLIKSVHKMLLLTITSNSGDSSSQSQMMNQLLQQRNYEQMNDMQQMPLSHLQQDSTSSNGDNQQTRQQQQQQQQYVNNNNNNHNNSQINNKQINKNQQQKKVVQQIGVEQKFNGNGSPTRVITEILNSENDVEYFEGEAGVEIVEKSIVSNSQGLNIQQQQQQRYQVQQSKGQQYAKNDQYNAANMNENSQGNTQLFVLDGVDNMNLIDDQDNDESSLNDLRQVQQRQNKNKKGDYSNNNNTNNVMNNDQNELSIIIEKECACQRRCSNDGTHAQMPNDNQNKHNIDQRIMEDLQNKIAEFDKMFKEMKLQNMMNAQSQQNDQYRLIQQQQQQMQSFNNFKQEEEEKMGEVLPSTIQRQSLKPETAGYKNDQPNMYMLMSDKKNQQFNLLPQQPQFEEESENEMNDQELDNYIFSNMEKNQQKMLMISKEKGLTDKVAIELELVKNLSTQQHPAQKNYQIQCQQQYASNSNKEVVHITASEMNSQSSIKNLGTSQMNQSQHTHQHQEVSGFNRMLKNENNGSDSKKELLQGQNQFIEKEENKEEEDESMEFIPDPNFLLKINEYIKKNDLNQNEKNTTSSNNIQDPPHQRLVRTNQEFYQANQADQQKIFDLMHPLDISSEGEEQQNFYPIINSNFPGGQLMVDSQGDAYQHIIGNHLEHQQNNEDEYEMGIDGQELEEDNDIGQCNAIQSSQGQGDRKVEYNYDEFNVFDEAEIVPNDDYYKSLSGGGGALPVMSEEGGDYVEDDEFLGTIRRNDAKVFMVDKSLREEEKKEDDQEEDSQNNGSVIHNSNSKEQVVVVGEESPSKGKRVGKLAEDEIIRLINEKYLHEESSKDVSIVYKDNKVFDEPKKAVYGIQKIGNEF